MNRMIPDTTRYIQYLREPLTWVGIVVCLSLAVSLVAKEKHARSQHQRDVNSILLLSEKLNTAENTFEKAKSELAKALAQLKTVQEERDQAVTDAAAHSKRAEKLLHDLDKVRSERDEAQQELAAYRGPSLMPNLPSWPPPRPSASWTRNLLSWKPGLTNWGQCADSISAQLGTLPLSYFGVPGGFAIVSSMQCVDGSGIPKPNADPARACETPVNEISMRAFRDALARLFSSEPGRSRVVIYLVSDEPITTPDGAPPVKTASWIDEGSNVLPDDLRRNPLNSSFALSVLIYEFSYSPADGSVKQSFPGETESRKQSIPIKF